jgi:murein DD-endopeptidase MepM/ murein hydrolase activator NlpD
MTKIDAKNPILRGGDVFVTYGFMEPRYGSAHYGVDVRTSKIGEVDDLVAIDDGVVDTIKDSVTKQLDVNIAANWSSPDALGNYVTIKHNDNYKSRYGHIKYGTIALKVGDKVKKGQVIGTMGLTGLTTGLHCHFEIWEKGVRIDGAPFLQGLKAFEKPSNIGEDIKTVEEIAVERIQGKWNNGDERAKRLTAAGYSPGEVQAAVNALLSGKNPPPPAPPPEDPLKKSVDTLAKEVIAGKWGNGDERVRRLTAAGCDAQSVQKRVNEMLKSVVK